MNRFRLVLALALLASLLPNVRAGERAANPELLKERRARIQAALTPEEFQRLRDAARVAMSDPAVQAAKSAGDRRTFREARRAAILKADPTLAPVLDKVRAAMGR